MKEMEQVNPDENITPADDEGDDDRSVFSSSNVSHVTGTVWEKNEDDVGLSAAFILSCYALRAFT